MADINIGAQPGFEQILTELYREATVFEDGRGTLTIRGAERFYCLPEGTLRNHFKSGRIKTSKLIKSLTELGFQVESFSEKGIPDAAIGVIGTYFSRQQKPYAKEVRRRCNMLIAMGARSFLQKIRGWHPPTATAPNQFEGIGYAIDTILAPLELKPELQAGIRAEAIAAQCPELRPAIEAAKKHLLLPTQSELLSPTELGEKLDPPISAQKVNKLLVEQNLQEKTGNRQCPYVAIGRGLDHSELVADTARGHSKTVQKLRWYESVLDLLRSAA
jgi:hypothetical protein